MFMKNKNPPCKKVKNLLQSLCFFIREDEEGGDKEWGNEKNKQKSNMDLSSGVFQCAKITWWNEPVVVTLWSPTSLASFK